VSASSAIVLMYHELEAPSHPVTNRNPDYLRYVVSTSLFRQHLEALRDSGAVVGSLSCLLNDRPAPQVVITFDDGAQTDLLAAVPLLSQFGYSACFYVVAGWIGRPGFLDPADLRELSSKGFEIGSHSLTHRYLSDLDDSALAQEIEESKRKLEDLLGHSVDHFSCPGGRWSQKVVEAVKRAGYKSMATSHAGKMALPVNAFELNRVAILRSTPDASVRKLALGQGLWREQAREKALGSAKAMLGNSRYDRLRSWVLAAWPSRYEGR
jgi:peptidoglycan/xylan/chitin deacetylase (PgdA/CDA1 family)